MSSRGALLLLLSLCPTVGYSSPPPGASPPGAPPPWRISFSISGGVSLGGYESGAVWTWLHYLRARESGQIDDSLAKGRRADLVGITGASAGGINALLSALVWCSTDAAAGTVDDNLVRAAWASVGFDGLLPAQGSSADFFPLDGVLTRHAFAPALERVQQAFDARTYRPGCRIPLAVTVTRGIPWEEDVEGLKVVNQRFALPLELVVDEDGHAWFINHLDTIRNAEQLGQYLLLAERRGADEKRLRKRTAGKPPSWVVPADVVLQAALATSAFPVAFSPVVLPQCLSEARCPQDSPPAPQSGFDWLSCAGREQCGDFTSLTCEGLSTPSRPLHRCASRFVDGGFFDNVPLGVAMAQAETSRGSAEGVQYVYFAPDVRRLRQETSAPVADNGDRGMRRVMQVLGNVAGTAQAYELYATLRFETFNQSAGAVLSGFASVLDEVSEMRGEAPEKGRPAPADIMACFDALEAQPAGDCPPLPAACTALASAAGGPGGTAGEETACLPPASARVSERLRALGRRLACRAAGPDVSSAEVLEQRRIAGRVTAEVSAVGVCIARTPPQDQGRVVYARFERMLRQARRFVSDTTGTRVPDRRLLMPTRFPPLAAGQLGNFGAFFDGPLRSYDYWAGVYDGVINLADWWCNDRSQAEGRPLNGADRQACVANETKMLRAALFPGLSPLGARVLDNLAMQEQIVAAVTDEPARPGPCGEDGSQCSDPPPCAFQGTDNDACRTHEALTRCAGTERRIFRWGKTEFCPGDFAIEAFVDALHAVGYQPQSAYMKQLMKDRYWWVAPAEEVFGRLEAIERSEAVAAGKRAEESPEHRAVHLDAEKSSQANAFAFAAGGSVLRSVAPKLPVFTLDPSSVPRDRGFQPMSLLPYRLAIDVYHGGAAIGWEPRLGGDGAVQGRFILDGVRWRDDGAGWRTGFSPALALRPWSSVAVGALAFGPLVERPWQTAGWDVGVAAHLDLVADKLRLSAGWMLYRFPDVAGDSTRPPVRLLLELSVIDVPGLVWLLRQ